MDKRKSKKKLFLKVVIVGDSGVGKTSLIHRYTTSRFLQEFKPTIGAEFSNKEVEINGQTVVAQIWDTAGQERYQSLGVSFYRGADCCGIVFDKTDRNSFENLETWRNAFLKHGAPKEDSEFPFVIIGNKADLTGELQIRNTEIQEW
jgi:Ras-related protein Rab-7A